jgi:hypothetical protein
VAQVKETMIANPRSEPEIRDLRLVPVRVLISGVFIDYTLREGTK